MHPILISAVLGGAILIGFAAWGLFLRLRPGLRKTPSQRTSFRESGLGQQAGGALPPGQ